MIKNTTPLSMPEVLEYLERDEENESEIKKFIKKFVKIKPEEAKKMKKELESLDMIKMKPEHIAKIIDIMPEDAENLNKIFNDVSPDEDESKKILDTISKFK